MSEKSIYYLTRETVSILTQTTDASSGEIRNHMVGYDNSESGRADLVAFESDEIVGEVMAVWGDTPTVIEPEYVIPNEDDASSTDNSNVWDEIAMAISTGVNEV